MALIDLSTKYALTNSILGSSQMLASTLNNESLIVEPASSGENQIWYMTSTNASDYYRLHTVQKGDYYALDVKNYIGYGSLDLHFFSVGDEYNGQFWKFDKWDDGSIKLSNNFTGPDIHLDVLEGSLQPKLAGGDEPGQHWTLSKEGSSPSATPKPLALSTTSNETPAATSIPTTSTTPAAKSTPATACPSTVTSCSMAPPQTGDNGLSTGVKAGISVAAAVVGLAVIGGVGYYMYRLWGKGQGPYTGNGRTTMSDLHL